MDSSYQTLIQSALSACPLFSMLDAAEIRRISAAGAITVKRYERDQIVAFEEDECTAMGVLAGGAIHIQRIFPSGKLITIETFGPGDSFGEALVFSDTGFYPATLVAREETTVVFLPRETIIELCTRSQPFLAAFLRALSNRILLLNRKIKNLSLGTVRQKVANFLLDEQRRQQRDILTLAASRAELADSLGIPRPSLSRELIAMKEAGWIDFDRRTVHIRSRPALEQAIRA
jgi:CRP-like cAMP-binding protein